MREGGTGRQSGWLDRRFAGFDRRLKGILGQGRIPGREKRAKAEQAMQAVDHLIEGIAEDLGMSEKSK